MPGGDWADVFALEAIEGTGDVAIFAAANPGDADASRGELATKVAPCCFGVLGLAATLVATSFASAVFRRCQMTYGGRPA